MKKPHRNACFALSIMTFAAVCSPVFAEAIYSASSAGQLSVLDVRNVTQPGQFEDLSLTGDAFVVGADALSVGLASADYIGFADLTGSLSLQSSAFGQAEKPGAAFSFHIATGFIDLLNVSGTDIFEIDFQLDYELAAMVEVDRPALDSAFAETVLTAFTLSNQFELALITDTDVMSDPIDIIDSAFFTLSLEPLGADAIDVTTFAQGEALVISLPPSLLQLGSLAVLFGLSRISRNRTL